MKYKLFFLLHLLIVLIYNDISNNNISVMLQFPIQD